MTNIIIRIDIHLKLRITRSCFLKIYFNTIKFERIQDEIRIKSFIRVILL